MGKKTEKFIAFMDPAMPYLENLIKFIIPILEWLKKKIWVIIGIIWLSNFLWKTIIFHYGETSFSVGESLSVAFGEMFAITLKIVLISIVIFLLHWLVSSIIMTALERSTQVKSIETTTGETQSDGPQSAKEEDTEGSQSAEKVQIVFSPQFVNTVQVQESPQPVDAVQTPESSQPVNIPQTLASQRPVNTVQAPTSETILQKEYKIKGQELLVKIPDDFPKYFMPIFTNKYYNYVNTPDSRNDLVGLDQLKTQLVTKGWTQSDLARIALLLYESNVVKPEYSTNGGFRSWVVTFFEALSRDDAPQKANQNAYEKISKSLQTTFSNLICFYKATHKNSLTFSEK